MSRSNSTIKPASRRIVPVIALIAVLGVLGTLTPHRSEALSTGSFQWDGTLRRVRVPILMYHYVSPVPANADALRLDLDVPPENFRSQMQWLKTNGYHTITPDQLAGALLRGEKLPPNPILLTFDDGYDDAYSVAFPILKELGFTGTFFVVSDFLDQNRGGYITWEQARQMAAEGMSIQDHSRQHKDMRGRTREWLDDEIIPSRDRIEMNTGTRPLFFCYPSGGYDHTAIDQLRAAGFVAAFTTNDGTYVYTDNMLRLPRVRIRGSTTLPGFARLITWER
jgi:peptidoglycan/xylan/chitin deacetylase (PgdA/CDA1 family)